MSYLDSLINLYEQEPVKPRSDAAPLPQKGFVASAHELAEKANHTTLPESQHISSDAVDSLLERTKGQPEGVRLRELAQYINTVENPDTLAPTVHTDLLPRNHPLSTKWISSFQVRKETANYYANHPKIKDAELRTLIASAIAAEPDTVERKFFVEAVSAKTTSLDALATINEADVVIDKKTVKN
jgi:hypothetical protein